MRTYLQHVEHLELQNLTVSLPRHGCIQFVLYAYYNVAFKWTRNVCLLCVGWAFGYVWGQGRRKSVGVTLYTFFSNVATLIAY